MRSGQRFHVFAVGLVVAAGAAGPLQAVHAEGKHSHEKSKHAEVKIAPPGSTPLGRSYSEWAAEWWKWALETPTSVNPNLDTTGEHCHVNQPEDVWFLAGSFGTDPVTRECTVPPGRPLLFPLINVGSFAFPTDPPEMRTEEFLRSQVAPIEDAVIHVEIDGVPVDNPRQYLEMSVVFDVFLPEENVFDTGEELTLSPSVDEGFYLFVFPLKPGEHTIHWQASSEAFDFSQDITYHITVPPPIQRFQAICTPDQEVPPGTESTARSVANLTVLNFPTGSVLITTRTDRRLTTPYRVSHIHLAQAGVTGPPVILYDPPDLEIIGVLAVSADVHRSEDLIGPLAGKTLHHLVEEIEAGNTYLNVHTERFPAGETRGQIETRE
jgi:hypothetical protein